VVGRNARPPGLGHGRKLQHEDGLAPLGLALPPRSATSGSEQFDGLKSSLPGQSPKSGGARTSASKYRPPVGTVLRFKRGTSELRPGERLTLLRLMKDMYLERLAAAGGEGTAILLRMKRRALRGPLPK
jgi:hypothetical protein